MACPDFPPVSESAPGCFPGSGSPAGSVLKHLICFMDPMKKCVSIMIWPDRTPDGMNRWESPSSPSLPQPARITKGSKSTSDPQGCFHSRPVRRLRPTAETYLPAPTNCRDIPAIPATPPAATNCRDVPGKPRRMLSRGHSDKTAM